MPTKSIEKAYEYCEQTVRLVKNLEEGFLTLGERLKKIRDGEMYRPSYESFYDFLVECRLTESKASKIISVYETYIEKYGLPTSEVAEVGWSLLYEVIKLVKSKAEAKEIVHELKHRQDKDARAYVLELKSGKSQDECRHANSYTIEVCRDCGRKIQTHEKDTA